jgi:metallo-beta-lactamase class B
LCLFIKRYRVIVLLALARVFALVLAGRRLNATKRGGQEPAEPFRIAGNLYYVGASESPPSSSPGPKDTSCSTAAIQAPRR